MLTANHSQVSSYSRCSQVTLSKAGVKAGSVCETSMMTLIPENTFVSNIYSTYKKVAVFVLLKVFTFSQTLLILTFLGYLLSVLYSCWPCIIVTTVSKLQYG